MRLHQLEKGARLAAAPGAASLGTRWVCTWKGAALGLLALASCGGDAGGDTVKIAKTRVATRPSSVALAGLDLMERAHGPEAVAAERQKRAARAKRPDNPLLYDVPEGWEELPRAQFRDINLRLKRDTTAEMVLTFLQNDGGGLIPNIDRWRKQVGLAPLTQAEAAALPTRTVFGRDATYVELMGPYQGMTGPRIEDGGIFGAIFSQGGGTLFVKMTGAREVLEAERGAFHGFLDSLAINPGTGPATASAQAPSAGAPRPSPLEWDTPEGWTEEASTSQFREVTFRKGGIEMYVSTARGNALDNITRWAGQIGQPPLDEAALAELERVEMMGKQGYVYAAEGSLQAMGARAPKSGQGMLAALVEGGGQIVTLKLTGPAADVTAARADFLQLAQSLRPRSTPR